MNWQVILIAGLLIFCVSTVTAHERTYYVVSNDLPKVNCPVESCQNLTALLDDIVPENISNVIIFLLPGIHQISTETRKVITITAASNLTISSFNWSTRAIIRCEGHSAFEFHSCMNLTIKDITIETCGAPRHFNHQKIPESNFSVYISHSLGVYIINTRILNGTGIGLVLENVQSELLISDSIISHNGCNLYLINYDNYTFNTTVASSIMVHNSSFSYARNQRLPDSGGIYVFLYQTKFLTELVLTHVNLVENKINLYLRLTLCNKWSLVKINNLRSIKKLNNEQNLHFEFAYSKKCDIVKQTNLIIDSAEIAGGNVFIQSRSQKPTELNNHKLIIIYNVSLSKSLLLVNRVKRVLFKNIVIQNTDIGSIKSMHIKDSVVAVRGYFLYQRNTRVQMAFIRSKITLGTNSTFSFRHNSHLPESPLYCAESHIIMMSGSHMNFSNNTGHESGGLTLLNSNITFKGDTHHMIFVHNTGKRGGAMAFYALSKLIPVKGQTNITFIYNHASIVGGAIYVQDYEYTSRQLSYKFIEPNVGIKPPNFNFVNNSATYAGDALYGGAGNKKDISFDESNKDKLSVGSTNPFKVCVCINSIPHCKIKENRYHPIPGQPFKIDVVAVGWWNGVVPANIQIEFRKTSKAKVRANEYIQSVGRNCTTLTYTLKFTEQYEIINLQVITINRNPVNERGLGVLLLFKNCTLGFSFESESSTCICNVVLIGHGVECDIETLTVKRQSPKWISATFEHLLTSDQSGVIVHDHCPYDYCEGSTDGAIQSLNLEYPDKQCAFNRSGTLCGGCQANFSQTLGTSKCQICTNSKLPLLLFLIALVGIALVVCLTLLNITVTVGTINGLIFYANIVKATDAFFFPQLASNSIFSIFIAWLNLDLGVETCFYDGLDAYAKAWLQFLFPLYIWLIVITIIVIAHYSTKASRLVGKNTVQVLATLFLLSYAKLLRTVITIFSSTVLTYPDGYVRRVWLYDGNVDFLKGRHIPLFIVALIFLILVSIPFTGTLICIQWLQKISHIKALFWVGKLQPLFDVYTGPYKIKHRYWTGLLLLVRVCLFLVFSLNTFGNPIINLLTIVAFTFSLFAYLSIVGGVYKVWWINLIETAFIMNLGLLSAAGLFKVAANVDITPITCTSTGITFVLSIAIISYHLAAKVSQTKYGQVLIDFASKLYHSLRERRKEIDTEVNQFIDTDISDKIVTYSEVELAEPLLVTN